jgi:hypothetical protein
MILETILLLVPLEIEQYFLSVPNNVTVQIIGSEARNISIPNNVKHIILFGSCGILQHHHKKEALFMPQHCTDFSTNKRYKLTTLPCDNNNLWTVWESITTNFLVKSDSTMDIVLTKGYYDFVDMEGSIVCEKAGNIPVTIVRYGIDYCNKPLKSKPIQRLLYRYYQHYRMQKLFSRILPCLISNIK